MCSTEFNNLKVENNDKGEKRKIENQKILDPVAAIQLSDKGYVDKHELASKAAYLLGLPLEKAEQFPDRFDKKIFKNLDYDKNARIIRNLCILRTAFLKNNLKIYHQMVQEHKGIYTIEEIPYNVIRKLSEDGVSFKTYHNPNPYEIEINRLIQERINNCKHYFPVWINWQYLRDLFVMPGGITEDGIKKAAAKYYENQGFYPYSLYINWEPYDCGDIFSSDLKFLKILYNQQEDEFMNGNMVSDVTTQTKDSVSEFLDNSQKIVLVVDCENSDPYNFYNAWKGLEDESLQKISKIILFIDPHITFVWQTMKEYVTVPVEEIMVERLHQNKSLVDMRLATATCKEHYVNNVDTFVLASSDSDFWGLIQSLPDARFLLMMERHKCGPDLKKVLEENGYSYCFTDMFYSGESELKVKSIVKGARDYIEQNMKLNIHEMMDYALLQTRIFASPQEKKQLIEKYFSKMTLNVDENGDLRIDFNIR